MTVHEIFTDIYTQTERFIVCEFPKPLELIDFTATAEGHGAFVRRYTCTLPIVVFDLNTIPRSQSHGPWAAVSSDNTAIGRRYVGTLWETYEAAMMYCTHGMDSPPLVMP